MGDPSPLPRQDLDALLEALAEADDDPEGAAGTLLGLVLLPAEPARAAARLDAVAEVSEPAALVRFLDGELPGLSGRSAGVLLAGGAAALRGGRDETAIEALREAVRTSESTSPPAARLLELALRRAGRHEEVVALLVAHAPEGLAPVVHRHADALWRAGDPEAAAGLTAPWLPDPVALGYAEEAAAGDPAALAELYGRAAELELVPELRARHAGLAAEPPDAAGDDWESVAGELRSQAETMAGSRRASALLLRAAYVALHGLDDAGRATTWLEEAAAAAPTDGRVLEALCEAHLRAGNPARAAALLEEPLAGLLEGAFDDRLPGPCLLAAALDDREPAALALACRAWAEALGAGPLAAALWSAAALLDPRETAARQHARMAVAADAGFSPAHLARLRAARAAGRSREVVEATRALVELLPDGEGDRAAELLQAAADAAEALGEDEDAAALRRRAAGCRAGAEAATEAAAVAWERRLEQEPGCDEALEALDNLYERLGRSARRREVLVSRLRRADAGLPVRRALARLELDLGDATAAVRLIEDPPEGTDPATLRLLARAAAAAGDEEAAALALETLARRITDPAERSRLYLRAAETYREVLGDVPVVLENAMLAFMCDRDHEEAFRTLARLYEQAERWREVVGICDLSLARARDGGPYEPAVLLRRRGRVEARHLDRPREAVATLLEALAVAPEDEETLGALDTLITATGDHAARRRMGELLAECGPAEGRRGALLLAAEGATMAGDRRGAVALLERALSRLPDDGEVADRLAEAYAELEDWPRLADLHLALTEGTPAAEQERAALLDAARVLEDRLSDLPGALLALERAVAAAPEDGELLDELAGRLEAAGHWDRMLAVTEHQWELAETDEQRALVRVRQGAVRRAGEDDRAGAEAAWREALEFDTGCLAALHALRELFSDGEDWDRLLEVLEAEVEVLRDDGARAEVLYRLGEVHLEGRRDPSAAAEAWRRALAAAPEHELSVRQLLYLLLAQRAWDEAAPLAEALVRLTAGAEDPQEPCHAWTLRARVALAQGQGNLAAEALVAALGVDPGSEPAQRVLAELVSSPAAGEVPAAQLDALEATLQGAGQRGQASMHLLRGRVAESELQTEEALERYRRSVEADPTSSGARRAWAGLLGRLRRWREAADVLAEAPELAAERGEWLLLQVEAADLRMERLEDVEGAVDTYAGVAEALSPPPDDERADREPPQTRSATAVSQAEALLRRALFGQAQGQRQLGRFEEAVTTVRRLCRLEEAHPVGAHGPASLGRYRHFLGRLYEEGLEDDEAARAAFCRGVEAAPGDPVCAIGLARFLARSDTDAADEALQEAIRAAEGEEGGPGGASAQRLVCYRARLWECAGDPQGAADLLMDAAGTAVDPVGPRKALAALYLRSFEHGVAFALSAYHEILRSDPASTDALRGLLDVYERTEQPDKLFHARAIHGLLSARAPEPEESAAREVSERLAGSAELEMGLVEQLLLHRQAKSPIWALWPVAAGYLALVYPVAPPADPGTRRVWPDQSDHPLSEALAGLRSFLGAELVDGLEVHVGPGRRGVVGYPGSPPALWVGEDVVFGETAPGALRFLLARAAVLLRDGRGLALVEDADAGISAVRSVAALFHAAVGSEPPGGGLPADLPRGLVRAARAALAGDTTFAEAEPDPEAYVEGVRRTADRVGLLACGDPVLALRVLVGRDAAVPDRCAQALRSQPDAAALVRFVVSEEHFAARQALGVALPRDEG